MQSISLDTRHEAPEAAPPQRTALPRRAFTRFRAASIRARLVMLLAAVLLPILLIQAATHYASIEAEREAELQADLEAARAVAAACDAYIRDVLHLEFMVGAALTAPASGLSAGQWLGRAAGESPSLSQISWLSPDGQLLASSSPGAAGVEAAFAACASEASSSGAGWWVGPLSGSAPDSRPVIAIARTIHEGGSPAGVVVATVDPQHLDTLLPVARSGGAAIALVGPQGHGIYRDPPQPATANLTVDAAEAALVARALAGHEATGILAASAGQQRLVAAAPIPVAGWAAVSSHPVAATGVLLLTRMAQRQWLLLVALGAAVAVTLATGQLFIAPLIHLRESALAFGRGERERRAPVLGPAEMRDLAVTFNRMADEITTREEQSARLLAEVQRQAAQLDATIASIPDGVLVFDPTGAIVRANAAAQAMFGYTPEEQRQSVPNRVASQRFLHPDGRPFSPDELASTRALRGETLRGMIEILHTDQRDLWLVVSAAPIYDSAGELLGAVAIFTDVTAQRELQEQREDMLRMVSHDLRGPLTVIHGQAELVLRRLRQLGSAARELHSVEVILDSARRMNRMIQDLVDAARLESHQFKLDPKPLELYPLVLDLKEQLATDDGARIEIEEVAGLPPVMADADRLSRVLANLLSNALKYSPSGSPVTVRFNHNGSQVLTSIVDRGQGIAREEMAHLFQRYYRTRSARSQHEGLGLGLYISKMLVEAHGGCIWVESEPGIGTTFHFSLPAAPTDQQRLQE